MTNCCQENHSKNTKRLNHPSSEEQNKMKKTTGFCLPRFRNRLKPKYGKDIYLKNSHIRAISSHNREYKSSSSNPCPITRIGS